MKKHATLMLVEGALFVAVAQILGYIKFWRMPWGGSVTLIMLPIIIYAVRWGLAQGLLAGFVLGVLQFMFDGGFVIGWQSILGDYVLAYTLVGLAGLMHGKKFSGVFGAILGGIGRYIPLVVTGATIWAEYMPEEFFGMTMTSPLVYSLLYNIAYVFPSVLLCALVLGLLDLPLGKYFRGEDLK